MAEPAETTVLPAETAERTELAPRNRAWFGRSLRRDRQWSDAGAEDQMSDRGINLKLEAERLSSIGSRLLDVALQVGQVAGHEELAKSLVVAAQSTSEFRCQICDRLRR
jgi:hypothetical protein